MSLSKEETYQILESTFQTLFPQYHDFQGLQPKGFVTLREWM